MRKLFWISFLIAAFISGYLWASRNADIKWKIANRSGYLSGIQVADIKCTAWKHEAEGLSAKITEYLTLIDTLEDIRYHRIKI